MTRRAHEPGLHLVALNEELAAEIRALPHDDRVVWTRHESLEALDRALSTLAGDRPASVVVTARHARQVDTETTESLVRRHRGLRLVVAVQRLEEGEEKRLVFAGVQHVVRPPFLPMPVQAWFHEHSYLDCLFHVPLEGARQEEHELLLPSRKEMVTATIRHLCGRFSELGYATDLVRSTLPLVLDEALTNAMGHGNGWDPGKRVYVRARLRPEGFEIAVSDEGDGFDRASVRDPLEMDNRAREGGRGLFLMEQLLDEVLYEDGGSTVILRKGHHAPLVPPARGERVRSGG